jgi:putative DNA methylase
MGALMIARKKLIEVALPLDAINKASAREKSIRHGHPSTLHLWWARRPLAAARAVIFAQMVDDPSSHPDIFRTEKAQEKERQRLFRIIEDLVQWENTTNDKVLQQARDEIWNSWRAACADYADHPRAKELYDRHKLPAFHDPFAGGGALPLEAQRLGLEAYASDLNPVAVLINKAMIEIPPKFAGQPPLNPESRKDHDLFKRDWLGAQGLAEDVRYYAQWMRDEAEKRIGQLYPKIEITPEMAKERPDLKAYIGKNLTVIAWLWTRTVKSPNPAFSQVEVPLASTFMLSTKAGKEAYVEPIVQGDGYRFSVKVGKPKDIEAAKNGTRAGKAQDFLCLMSGVPVPRSYVRDEGKAGRVGARLMAIVAEGDQGRIYLPPTELHESLARRAIKNTVVDEARSTFLSGSIPTRAMITGGVCSAYGLSTWGLLFTPRQIVALTTFSSLVHEAHERAKRDFCVIGSVANPLGGNTGDTSAEEYARALSIYLAIGVSRQANRSAELNFWDSQGENIQQVFGRQALAMTWDFVEGNPLSESTGNFLGQIGYIARALLNCPNTGIGHAIQQDATTQAISDSKVVSTDPPYFDNISYAELSDFFYVWLRQSLKSDSPDLFATVAVPKAEELIASPYRHGGKEKAEKFFLDGMTQAMGRIAEQSHHAFPVTIYYAFKQSETEKGDTASTGWETFLDAVIEAGFELSGTWPMRTEYTGNLKRNVSVLASSIILVCRPRATDAPTGTRREFVTALKEELPEALKNLQRANIAPVDLAQAAIGPGMAVYTRYSKVIDAEGKPLSVRQALSLINQNLDELLTEQEGDFDADSRWALAWFEQSGFDAGEYGVAEMLSKAKNTSVAGMVEARIVASKGGKVRLLRPDELPTDWDPKTDPRLTAWESVHQLVRVLEAAGENAAAELVAKLGSEAEVARELAYRLYTVCERKKRAQEALSYNSLVQSWPEITRMARDSAKSQASQTQLFDRE